MRKIKPRQKQTNKQTRNDNSDNKKTKKQKKTNKQTKRKKKETKIKNENLKMGKRFTVFNQIWKKKIAPHI